MCVAGDPIVSVYAPFAHPRRVPSSAFPPRLWRLFGFARGECLSAILSDVLLCAPRQIARFSQAFQGSIPTVPIAARRAHKRRRYAEAEEEKTGKRRRASRKKFRQVMAA